MAVRTALGGVALRFVVRGVAIVTTATAAVVVAATTVTALGGALGGTLGMRIFHHKTKHKEFRFGFPALLCLQCAAVVYLILIWKQVI